MPIMTNVEFFYQQEQPTLYLRQVIHVKDMAQLISTSFQILEDYLEALGEMVTDVPYVAYHNMDMENLDVEVGMPVRIQLPGKDDIQAAVMQEGRVASAIFMGPLRDGGPLQCGGCRHTGKGMGTRRHLLRTIPQRAGYAP